MIGDETLVWTFHAIPLWRIALAGLALAAVIAGLLAIAFVVSRRDADQKGR